ncbi:uncharacterized protein LOC134839965 [Symsagittifera roscoffensis]|uniref:uncharacterized protein LOC134839965 n=1 Tax=Symsagittifera roscoffensis TaxID=84072 RepID=UPI00307B854C
MTRHEKAKQLDYISNWFFCGLKRSLFVSSAADVFSPRSRCKTCAIEIQATAALAKYEAANRHVDTAKDRVNAKSTKTLNYHVTVNSCDKELTSQKADKSASKKEREKMQKTELKTLKTELKVRNNLGGKNKALYKTSLCHNYRLLGVCPSRKNCSSAHGQPTVIRDLETTFAESRNDTPA